MYDQRVNKKCKEEYRRAAVGKKGEHDGKEEEKQTKSKKLQNNKVGHTLELGPLLQPFGFRVGGGGHHQNTVCLFFSSQIEALALQTLFSFFFSN
jgi:hypothetical protein